MGDKHEFPLVFIKHRHDVGCPSFDITHDCLELSGSDILLEGAVICNCMPSANEWFMIECESIMVSSVNLH